MPVFDPIFRRAEDLFSGTRPSASTNAPEPFSIGQDERDMWVKAMLGAMDEVQIPEPAYSTMRQYFEQGATFMINVLPPGGRA